MTLIFRCLWIIDFHTWPLPVRLYLPLASIRNTLALHDLAMCNPRIVLLVKRVALLHQVRALFLFLVAILIGDRPPHLILASIGPSGPPRHLISGILSRSLSLIFNLLLLLGTVVYGLSVLWTLGSVYLIAACSLGRLLFIEHLGLGGTGLLLLLSHLALRPTHVEIVDDIDDISDPCWLLFLLLLHLGLRLLLLLVPTLRWNLLLSLVVRGRVSE